MTNEPTDEIIDRAWAKWQGQRGNTPLRNYVKYELDLAGYEIRRKAERFPKDYGIMAASKRQQKAGD